MGAYNAFESSLEEMLRNSEVLAVARALESGASPRVGEWIDYYLEAAGLPGGEGSPRRRKPYRTAIEQWHLDAAVRLIAFARAPR